MESAIKTRRKQFHSKWEDVVAVATYHGGAVRTRVSDHLAGVVDEVGHVGIDGRACGCELALVCLVAFVSLVL